MKYFRLPAFWNTASAMIPVAHQGERLTLSLQEAAGASVITVLGDYGGREGPVKATDSGMTADDVHALSDEHRTVLFRNRVAQNIRWLPNGEVTIDWARGDATVLTTATGRPIAVSDCPDEALIGFAAHKTTDSVYAALILNARNPFVQWVTRVAIACSEGRHGLRQEQANRLVALLDTPVRYHGHETGLLMSYLQRWKQIQGLPPELLPPELDLEQALRRRPVVGGAEHKLGG